MVRQKRAGKVGKMGHIAWYYRSGKAESMGQVGSGSRGRYGREYGTGRAGSMGQVGTGVWDR